MLILSTTLVFLVLQHTLKLTSAFRSLPLPDSTVCSEPGSILACQISSPCRLRSLQSSTLRAKVLVNRHARHERIHREPPRLLAAPRLRTVMAR